MEWNCIKDKMHGIQICDQGWETEINQHLIFRFTDKKTYFVFQACHATCTFMISGARSECLNKIIFSQSFFLRIWDTFYNLYEFANCNGREYELGENVNQILTT